MARSMLSMGILAARHLSNAMRKRGFMSGSAPPILVAIAISLPSFEKIRPRLASIAPLKCLTFAHLLCPAMSIPLRFHQDSRPVAQDLADAGRYLRGIVADPDHRVSPQCAAM